MKERKKKNPAIFFWQDLIWYYLFISEIEKSWDREREREKKSRKKWNTNKMYQRIIFKMHMMNEPLLSRHNE